MRRLLPLLLAVLALLALPATSLGHAVFLSSDPAAGSTGNEGVTTLTLRFSEPVVLLDPGDLTVVDEEGRSLVAGSPRVVPGAADSIEAELRPDAAEGTYTAQYRVVSADSHIIPGYVTFAVGPGPVGPPNLGGGAAGEGPSITSAWAVSARFLEIVGFGGLLGLMAFRWLVWRPVWGGRWVEGMPDDERATVLAWGRDLYWVVFGVLAVGSMVAEAYLLVTYSASALGTTVWDTLRDAAGIGDILATTRLGSLLQLRGGLLFALFAIGAWQFLAEFGSSREPKPARPTGGAAPAAVMAVLIVVVLYGISSQGHASQAPAPAMQIASDLVHLSAGAVWIAGLALTGWCLYRLPRLAGPGGARVATGLLARFSSVALAALVVVAVTGTIRTVGQLSDPAQLWETDYGQSILIKLGLLLVIAPVALRNRRITNTLVLRRSSNGAALRMVRRAVTAELVAALVIVAVAALLVAQVPGRV